MHYYLHTAFPLFSTYKNRSVQEAGVLERKKTKEILPILEHIIFINKETWKYPLQIEREEREEVNKDSSALLRQINNEGSNLPL